MKRNYTIKTYKAHQIDTNGSDSVHLRLLRRVYVVSLQFIDDNNVNNAGQLGGKNEWIFGIKCCKILHHACPIQFTNTPYRIYSLCARLPTLLRGHSFFFFVAWPCQFGTKHISSYCSELVFISLLLLFYVVLCCVVILFQFEP